MLERIPTDLRGQQTKDLTTSTNTGWVLRAGRPAATCGPSLCRTQFKGVGSDGRTPPVLVRAYQTARPQPLAGSAHSHQPVVILVVNQLQLTSDGSEIMFR
jgi:hypothetical protein